jgi:hypothetical protein
MYTQKPLPTLPSKASTSSTIMNSNLNSKTDESGPVGRSSTDRLRLTCHHGLEPSEVHEVETTLDFVQTGPSQLERYAGDEQEHERIALALPRRAGQKRPGTINVARTNTNSKRFRKRKPYDRVGNGSGHDPERMEEKEKEKEKERDSPSTSSSRSP